jgi:hypothetical protein
MILKASAKQCPKSYSDDIMDNIETARELVVPVAWLITIIGALGGVIATLAGVLWSTMKERLSVQDDIIKKLQDDVDRMSKGCGIKECMWRSHH